MISLVIERTAACWMEEELPKRVFNKDTSKLEECDIRRMSVHIDSLNCPLNLYF